MKAFIVELQDKPGTLAKVLKAVADRGVNTLTCGLSAFGRGATAMVVSDEAATRTALADVGCTHREIEILPVAMQHIPGEAYRTCQKLADAGINIELFLPTGSHDGKFIVALGCDNTEAARRTLGTQVVKEYGDLWPKAMAGVR